MMAVMYLPFGFAMADLAPLLLIAATFVQFWAGGLFYQAAWAAAKHRTTNMNTLVAVGTASVVTNVEPLLTFRRLLRDAG